MQKNVLFLQGGGGEEDYAADAKLVASLQKNLGDGYIVHYPVLTDDESLPDFGRKKQIQKAMSLIGREIILIAHSLGASMLLKYLSETQVEKKIVGIFLLATPYWSGDEEWKAGLKLKADFADKMPQGVPVFFYHCQDDDVIPIHHLEYYRRNVPHATLRMIATGGHQFNDDLSIVAKDIKRVFK